MSDPNPVSIDTEQFAIIRTLQTLDTADAKIRTRREDLGKILDDSIRQRMMLQDVCKHTWADFSSAIVRDALGASCLVCQKPMP